MTEIVDGTLIYNETTRNANGGTELMARRMVRDIPTEYLKGYQIIHSRVRDLNPNLKKILVCHDLANDPEVARLTDPDYLNQFEKIVFVSNWQQHTYNMVLGVPFSKSVVIRNAIELTDIPAKSSDGKIKLIYHTTPHRGLELLIPAFEEASKQFDLHLDVFSSFNAYGWGERDKNYQHLFDKINNLPNVTNHGFQPNDVVRDYLKKSDIFAYPNIWPETSCLAMIEALCFNNYVIHSNLGALPETSCGLTSIYMYDEDANTHVNRFYRRLMEALHWITNNRESAAVTAEHVGMVARNHYNWNSVKNDWIELLRELR